MSDVVIPGGRDVRGTLAEPATESDAVVVACPPHPQQGGSRRDDRLRTLEAALLERDIACLRFDYGQWDEGYGEREDVRNAVRWAAERYDRVGLFGYSFGATLALVAADSLEAGVAIDAVAALAPTARLADDLDALEALAGLEMPLQIQYGERDTTVEWEPIVERASERDASVVELPADHFFLGQTDRIASEASAFFRETLST